MRSHSPAGCLIGIRADVSETPAIPLSWPALPDIMSETLLSMVFLDEVPEFRRYVLGVLQPPPRLSHAYRPIGHCPCKSTQPKRPDSSTGLAMVAQPEGIGTDAATRRREVMRHPARAHHPGVEPRDQPRVRLHKPVAHRLLEKATAASGIVHPAYASVEA